MVRVLSAAGKWRAYSDLCARAGLHEEAAWSALRAAWVSDDAGTEEEARSHRLLAADRFRAALKNGEALSEQPFAGNMVLIDCLRRSGSFEEAQAELAVLPILEGTLATVAKFENALISERDGSTYTVSDAGDWMLEPITWRQRRIDLARLQTHRRHIRLVGLGIIIMTLLSSVMNVPQVGVQMRWILLASGVALVLFASRIVQLLTKRSK